MRCGIPLTTQVVVIVWRSSSTSITHRCGTDVHSRNLPDRWAGNGSNYEMQRPHSTHPSAGWVRPGRWMSEPSGWPVRNVFRSYRQPLTQSPSRSRTVYRRHEIARTSFWHTHLHRTHLATGRRSACLRRSWLPVICTVRTTLHTRAEMAAKRLPTGSLIKPNTSIIGPEVAHASALIATCGLRRASSCHRQPCKDVLLPWRV